MCVASERLTETGADGFGVPRYGVHCGDFMTLKSVLFLFLENLCPFAGP